MNRLVFAVGALVLLTACETQFQKDVSSASAEKTIDVAQGEYLGKFRDGCGKLNVGENIAYEWDKGCDGSVEYSNDNVALNGRVMRIGGATYLINENSDQKMNGIWKFRSDPFPMTFERRS